MPPRPELQAAALGALQGVTELLPVSSSAHVAALPYLLGWPARDKAFEVALHAGAAAALAPGLLRALPGPRTLALSLAPPVIIGYLLERPIEERLAGPAALAGGLLAGGGALAAADKAAERRRWGGAATMRRAPWGGAKTSRRAPWGGAKTPRRAPWGGAKTPRRAAWGGAKTPRRAAWGGAKSAPWGGAEVPWRDALALGLAQAAALAPGVSRTGATLAAARVRGFRRPAASALSFGVAGPVLAGATALKAWRTRGRFGRDAAIGGVAAFAATRAALSLIGFERRAPLWPWAAERALLAGAILAVRYRRGR